MKLINNKLWLAVVSGAMLTTAGCKKLSDFGDTNVNPAATTTPITSALLTNALVPLATTGATGGFATDDKAGIFAQYFAESSYPASTLYTVPQVEFDGVYSGPLNDLQNILNTSTNEAEKGVARIVKAYYFWRLTDRFGDIPYFQALKGATVPGYDKQELIYKDLIKELTEANVQVGAGGVIKGDIMYGNDLTKWKKLANSLRMNMALRLSKRYPGPTDYAATEFKAGLAAGPIEENADNWTMNFPGNTNGFSNPFFIVNEAQRDYGVAERMGQLLTSLGDTRAGVYASSTDYVPYGLKEADINIWRNAHPNWARTFSTANRTKTSPLYLMTAARTWLARAEASVRGWTTGVDPVTAAVAFERGVDRAFSQWGLTASAGYKAQTNVNVAAPALANIHLQQYLEAFPDGTEGWSVWRRTGVPTLTPSPNPADLAHTTIPRRYTYGQRQLSLNAAGVAQAVASQGADKQETRVWWDL